MKRYILIAAAFWMLVSCIWNNDSDEITIAELKDHIEFLASEKLEGRMPGSAGDQKAAEFILHNYQSNNLTLYEGSGKQPFEIVLGNKMGEKNFLSFNHYKATLNEAFVPFPFSGNGQLEKEVVFAGYGFNIESQKLRWNDYKNIHPDGKWVMILQGAPDIKEYQGVFRMEKDDRSKALKAKELGAGGILFVTNKKQNGEPEFVNPTIKEGNIDIPVINISPQLADKLLKNKDTSVQKLKSYYKEHAQTKSFKIAQKVKARVDLREDKVTTQNVIAKLPAESSKNYIIIGAHYDHLGYGGPNSGSRKPDTNAVHYGADDNASGVAAMLEIAEKLESIRDSLNKNLVFIGFGAEEQGLIGSKYFMEHTNIDPNNIEAMINIDMIGRLRDENSLQVGGTGSSQETDSLLKAHNETYNFKLGFSKEGYGPSDHSSFYSYDIPVFFFSTGAHMEYHTPKDKPSKINYRGLKEVTNYIYDLTKNLASSNMKLTFQEAGPKSPDKQKKHRKALKVTLGIMPDFAGIEDRGLRADLVVEGKPADRAGMKKGDIITAINGHEVEDVYDYMNRLSKIKPGQTITVEIIRDDKKKVLMVQL